METLHRQTKTYLFLPFKERESGDISATVKTALLKEMGLRGWCLTEREREREASSWLVTWWVYVHLWKTLYFVLWWFYSESFLFVNALFCFLFFSFCMQYHEKENDFESSFLFCGFYVHYICILELFEALFCIVLVFWVYETNIQDGRYIL